MDIIPAPEVNVVKQNKKSLKLLLIPLLFLILAGVFGFLFSDKVVSFINKIPGISKNENTSDTISDSPFANLADTPDLNPSAKGVRVLDPTADDNGIVKLRRVGYDERIGLPADSDGLVKTYYIDITSSGDVYKKDVEIGDGRVAHLFILKGSLENLNNIEAVVGISFDNETKSTLNWWLYNLLDDKDESGNSTKPEVDLNNLTYDEISLESIFKKDSVWKYAFYFDNKINYPDDMRSILKELYVDMNPNDIFTDLKEKGSTSNILMPF